MILAQNILFIVLVCYAANAILGPVIILQMKKSKRTLATWLALLIPLSIIEMAREL